MARKKKPTKSKSPVKIVPRVRHLRTRNIVRRAGKIYQGLRTRKELEINKRFIRRIKPKKAGNYLILVTGAEHESPTALSITDKNKKVLFQAKFKVRFSLQTDLSAENARRRLGEPNALFALFMPFKENPMQKQVRRQSTTH